MDRPRRARSRLSALFDGPDGPPPGGPCAERRSAADEHAIALDHRHLWVHGRGIAAHHGDPWRPHREAPAVADRRRQLWSHVVARRLLRQRRDAHREPGPDGYRRGDTGAWDALAHLHHVPQPRPAGRRHRGLDHRFLGRRCHRPRGGRSALGAVLVGLGVSPCPPRDGTAADPRTARAPRVPGPRGGTTGYRLGGDVA